MLGSNINDETETYYCRSHRWLIARPPLRLEAILEIHGIHLDASRLFLVPSAHCYDCGPNTEGVFLL